MTTVGNPHVDNPTGGSTGNGYSEREIIEEEVTDPTLGNGDGTYDVSVGSARVIEGTDNVLGVEWTGTHKVSVDSVSGNTVSVLFESPSGTDTFTNEADGQVTGTLVVTVVN